MSKLATKTLYAKHQGGKLMGYTTVANTTWRVNILIPLP